MSRMADEAVLLGPARARDSYLNIERVIDGARKQRRRGHASRLRLPVRERRIRAGLRDAGLVFVGPTGRHDPRDGLEVAARKR